MKKLFFTAWLLLAFNHAAAQIRIQPDNPTELSNISVQVLMGCDQFMNGTHSINGNEVTMTFDFIPCTVGVVPPQFWYDNHIGQLTAGEYLFNIHLNDLHGPPGTIYTFSYNVTVGPGPTSVPINNLGSLLFLMILIGIIGAVIVIRKTQTSTL